MNQNNFHQTSHNLLNHNAYFFLGLPGSGKSYWVDKLSSIVNMPAFHLDDAIEQSEQKTIAQIFKEHGETYFRNKETEVLKNFSNKPSFIISVGGGTPCYNNNMDWMNANGITIWLNESIKTIEQRLLKEKFHRPLIADVTDEKLFSFLSEMLHQRIQFYSKAAYQLKENEINEASFIKIFAQYE